MIVDLEPGTQRRAAGRPAVMGIVVGALAIGLGALLVRPAADPAETTLARDRIASALALPAAQPAGPIGRPAARGPSVLAQMTPRPALPPALALPADVAALVPAESREADRATLINVSDESRQLVYKLRDGRYFAIIQSQPGQRHVVLASYTVEDGTVRGRPAQFVTSRLGALRSMVSWTEGPSGYRMYSTSLSVRDLVRLAEQLR